MSSPHIPQKSPIPVLVEAGKTYYWCSCDGAHKGSAFTPVPYKAEANGTVYFCACKHSKKGALCDGSHKAL
jgi:CDGSH-type Zn-finger protein